VRRTLAVIVAAGLALLGLSGNARAQDRIAKLVRILETDPSYKVRLQVVIALGKLKDRRAAPALIKALSDDNYTVRGVSCASLAQLGDKSALPELRRVAKNDSEDFVRSQADKAIKVLGGGGGAGPPTGARFYITVGKISNKSPKGGARASKVLGDSLLKEFSRVGGVATDWGGRAPTAAELSKARVKGFVLDGSILSLTATRSGGNVEISCNIKVSLATFPGNSMKAFYSGGASTEVSASSFRPEQEDGLFRDVLEGAAQGAKQQIVQSYLSTQ
jgi:hypothetical protein